MCQSKTQTILSRQLQKVFLGHPSQIAIVTYEMPLKTFKNLIYNPNQRKGEELEK